MSIQLECKVESLEKANLQLQSTVDSLLIQVNTLSRIVGELVNRILDNTQDQQRGGCGGGCSGTPGGGYTPEFSRYP